MTFLLFLLDLNPFQKKVSESLDRSWLGGVGGDEAAHQVQVEEEEVALPLHLRFQQAGR